jgi:ribonuclease BN (tRNA processing enzyme)
LLFTKSFPLDLGDIAADLNIVDLNETNYIIFKNGEDTPKVIRVNDLKDGDYNDDDVVITCYKSYAHPQNGVLVYKIMYKGKSLVYATDKESYPGGDKKLVKFAKGCDLIIHDAQYSTEDYLSIYVPKQGFGHSTFEMALDCKRQVEAKKLVFFHYDPCYNDEKLNLLAEEYADENAIMATEGLEISLL